MTSGTAVLAFLGHDDSDPVLFTQATAAVATVEAMVAAYCRGRHKLASGQTRDGVDEVILTAAARLVTNPSGIPYDTGGVSIRGGFTGFTLVELAVLNRYRVRAL